MATANETTTATAPASPTPPATKPGDGKIRVTFENSPFKVHPEVLALGIPTQTSAEYTDLLEDIKSTPGSLKVRDKIKLSKDPITKEELIVDGLHRMHIAADLGLKRGEGYQVEWVDYNEAAEVAMSSQKRRSLTDGQRTALASRWLKLEETRAKARSAANARVATMLRAVDKPQIIEVGYDLIAKGGPIASTFSADTIATTSKTANSKIRGSFEYDGKSYVVVDGVMGSRLVAYELLSIEDYRATNGELTSYFNRAQQWENNENLNNLDGIMVTWKQKAEEEGKDDITFTRILTGPPVIFSAKAADEDAVDEDEDGKGKKGKGKKKQKAAEEVAKRAGVSTRSVEMFKTIQKEDPEAAKRIEENGNQPNTSLPETINSAYMRVINARKVSDETAEQNGDSSNAAANDDRAPQLPNPNDMTIDEFLEGHPLYAELADHKEHGEAFKFAVSEYCHLVGPFANLKAKIKTRKIAEKAMGDDFSRLCKIAASVTHPYKWYLDLSKKGGFSIRKPQGEAGIKAAQVASGAKKTAAPAKPESTEVSVEGEPQQVDSETPEAEVTDTAGEGDNITYAPADPE